jgi:hypothetical protein
VDYIITIKIGLGMVGLICTLRYGGEIGRRIMIKGKKWP